MKEMNISSTKPREETLMNEVNRWNYLEEILWPLWPLPV
jgi:hypothetical protein